ncbi:glycosyltransferase [Thiohalorhabdus sp.]|uniref:glycosyltransferase n=1 Tax=Thiohalorhabdus sp. TaxID=3094134 RepID=UPI002FC2F317
MTGQRILFAVHDWGLGHATRDLVLIRGLLEANNEVVVLSTGRALRLLQEEIGDRCELVELRDIPKPLSRRPAAFYVKMSLALPLVFATFVRERRFARALVARKGIDRIVSDSRFGVALREVPSYYVFHSLRQIIPGRPYYLEKMVECAQKGLLSRARRILVPDEPENGLSGELAHDLSCDWGDRLRYIGALSSVSAQAGQTGVDYFISISGAEPQRTLFEERVLAQVADLPGRVVVALGKPDSETRKPDQDRVVIYNYLNRQDQQAMMNRARLVICRSGYTTLMELAQLHKPALFVPTPGQSEQEHLADYHCHRGHTYAVSQNDLDLPRDVAEAERYPGLPRIRPPEDSVRRFLDAISD